ncbi:unnamed protein product [Rhizophagus irregularis]|nr:unnamed protein product [Rhizophagus irregularis]
MNSSIKHQHNQVSQQKEISQQEEISSTIVNNIKPQKTNYKKYLTDFVEYANEGIHSSINSLQSINITQKISHIYEMPSSFILPDDDLFAPTFILSDFKTYQILRRIETFNENDEEDNFIKNIKYINGFGAMEVYKFMESQLNDKYSLYLIEWICMQDPCSKFSQNRPQFPGQNYPGLRIGRKVNNMLIDLAHKGDGLSNIPENFHNAYIYHTQDYTFLNPAFQAYFDCLCDSLKNDLKVHGLSAVSWAFHNGHVKNLNGEIEIWKPEEQVYSISSKLSSYFVSHGYKSLYNIFRKRDYQVSIDWNNAKEIWKFSLNHQFVNYSTAEDIICNIHNEDEKKNELNIIKDVANEHQQNGQEHIWIPEKSKI